MNNKEDTWMKEVEETVSNLQNARRLVEEYERKLQELRMEDEDGVRDELKDLKQYVLKKAPKLLLDFDDIEYGSCLVHFKTGETVRAQVYADGSIHHQTGDREWEKLFESIYEAEIQGHEVEIVD